MVVVSSCCECRVKSITAQPLFLVASGSAGDSRETASVSCEEGGDDVKSSRPLRPGPHTCYNGGDNESLTREGKLIFKPHLSSDRGLQLDSVKLESLVIAISHDAVIRSRALYTPPVKPWKLGAPEVGYRKGLPRANGNWG